MRVSNWEERDVREGRELSAIVDGFRLWYRIPSSLPFVRSGDPFVAAALLPAMARHECLDVDPSLPVSPMLLRGLAELQKIHHSWNPALEIVPVYAEAAPAGSLQGGAISFFSGGVDSIYSFLKRKHDISHLVFIQGFDFYFSCGDHTSFSVEDISNLAQLSHKLSKPMRPLEAMINSRLSDVTRRTLSSFLETASAPEALEEALAEDLDRIIKERTLYAKGLFSSVNLRPETKSLLDEAATVEVSARLNRLLLEDAFPLEIARSDSSDYLSAVARNTAFAASFGKTLIPVATNIYPFGYRCNLSRNLTQGSALASIALLLGFARAFVPAAYSYSQLIPLGSHPLTDPLWSSEGVKIVHEGAEARRVDKVVRIAGDKPSLTNLRVCFENININCGHCAKCLRTMIPLRILGIEGAPFPPGPLPEDLRKIKITTDIEKIFFLENINLALQTDNVELGKALNAALRRYERRVLIGDIDKAFFSGFFKRLFRKTAGAPSELRRIDTTPSPD